MQNGGQEKLMEVNKTIKDSFYYYGCSAVEFRDMNYLDALHYKLKKAEELKRELAEKQAKIFEEDRTSDKYVKITQRISDIEKAIIFNKELIREAKGK